MDTIAIILTIVVAFICGGGVVSYIADKQTIWLAKYNAELSKENTKYRQSLKLLESDVARLRALAELSAKEFRDKRKLEKSFEDERPSMFSVKQAS